MIDNLGSMPFLIYRRKSFGRWREIIWATALSYVYVRSTESIDASSIVCLSIKAIMGLIDIHNCSYQAGIVDCEMLEVLSICLGH